MNKHENNSEPKRILRRREVLKIVGVSTTTLWRMEKAGRFPKRVSLGPNCSGWISEEIDNWYEALTKNRDTAVNEQ
ncbi:MAG: AlpA family phage regulatory protein [Desulfobacter postgatei]|uniref:helix-turn-helix transcriptional regulator n=1 Tax=Desulfobacter postgatei TaxID=2293 RepID=UPI0023F10D5F|nr:AlpA family phage regulatory protein [Desulfobacter postgatei]MDD4273389.1 AlpA family phage regulatory protein [Desulfobacter postgatei]